VLASQNRSSVSVHCTSRP